MRYRTAIIPALVFFVCGMCGQAMAMRCGNDLAYEGLTRTEVVNNCGPPKSTRVVRQYYENTRYNNQRLRVKVVVEEWT